MTAALGRSVSDLLLYPVDRLLYGMDSGGGGQWKATAADGTITIAGKSGYRSDDVVGVVLLFPSVVDCTKSETAALVSSCRPCHHHHHHS